MPATPNLTKVRPQPQAPNAAGRHKLLLVLIVVLAASAPHNRLQADDAPAAPRRHAQLFVVLIGGMNSDPTPGQISGTALKNEGNSGMYQLCRELQHAPWCTAEYFNWNGTRAGEIARPNSPGAGGIAAAIAAHIQAQPNDRTAIVGNSWGGHTAVETARELLHRDAPLALDRLVLIDASSTGRVGGPINTLPVNVNQTVNYFTHNVFVWGRNLGGRTIEHVDLGDPQAGFRQSGGPAYDAAFDFAAHVSAEWDTRIHADVKRRLAAILHPE